ncbi:MAG TPA: hypothetical protein VMN60_14140 [Longimicrobiales bacterium]|nr:hypothetical protein [Longimicrobiales bacterium]
MQALQAATLRGAELLGRAADLGTLERGKFVAQKTTSTAAK